MIRTQVAFVLGALVVGSVSAEAAPTRERFATATFAVPRDPSGQKAAAAVGALIRSRIAAHERLRLIEPGRILSGDPRTREEEMLDRARAALADGRRAYDALSLDDAIARLGQAVNLYQQAGPLMADLGEFKTALAYLGAALTLRGSADEGQSTFYELLTIDASYTLAGFPPAVNKVFDGAVDRLNESTTGNVEIYSTPPHAAVFIDGRFRGVTPLTVDAMTAGTHYLRLEKNGYVVFGGPLDISPKQRITSQTRLRDIKRGPELRDLLSRAVPEINADGMGGHLRSLSRLLLADTLIVVGVSQSGKDASLTGAVFDGHSATRLATERAVLAVESEGFEREIGELVERLINAAVSGVATETAEPSSGGTDGAFGLNPGGATQRGTGTGGVTNPNSTPTSSVRNPDMVADGSPKPGTIIGWGMIGVGAAALGTGVAFGVLALQTQSDFNATQQASPDLRAIADEGKTRALVADLAIFGGGALVAGGVVVLILTALERPTPTELLGQSGVGFAPTEGGFMVTVGSGIELP